MNKVLSEANKILHKDIKKTDAPFCIRRRDKLIHICLGSVGCRFSRSGSCTMCNYGFGKTVSKSDIENIIESIKGYSSEIDSVLVGTNGSVFDTLEIPEDIFDVILNSLNSIDIKVIIFETHYTTVTNEILDKIADRLIDKDIVIEMGLESADMFVREQCLNKSIDLNIFAEKTKLIHDYKMSASANIFLGAPFLSAEEQIIDTLNTIQWSVDNGIDSIVVFPANIRDNTVLAYLYKRGRYFPISKWAIAELLNRIPDKVHKKIYISWFGDWDDERILIKPEACDICNSRLDEFFVTYLSTRSENKRKTLVQELIRDSNMCGCYSKFLNSLNSSKLKYDNVKEQQEWLARELKIKF